MKNLVTLPISKKSNVFVMLILSLHKENLIQDPIREYLYGLKNIMISLLNLESHNIEVFQNVKLF